MCVYPVPKSASFGKESEWQYNTKFLRDVKKEIEKKNDNEYQICEEQIEDVIHALWKMGRVILCN